MILRQILGTWEYNCVSAWDQNIGNYGIFPPRHRVGSVAIQKKVPSIEAQKAA